MLPRFHILQLLFLIVMVSGCADHVTFTVAAKIEPVGFWFGVWHGFTLPFSWLGSLFSDDIAVYAIYNNGGWYDAGFAWGVGSIATLRGLVWMLWSFLCDITSH